MQAVQLPMREDTSCKTVWTYLLEVARAQGLVVPASTSTHIEHLTAEYKRKARRDLHDCGASWSTAATHPSSSSPDQSAVCDPCPAQHTMQSHRCAPDTAEPHAFPVKPLQDHRPIHHKGTSQDTGQCTAVGLNSSAPEKWKTRESPGWASPTSWRMCARMLLPVGHFAGLLWSSVSIVMSSSLKPKRVFSMYCMHLASLMQPANALSVPLHHQMLCYQQCQVLCMRTKKSAVQMFEVRESMLTLFHYNQKKIVGLLMGTSNASRAASHCMY